MKKLWLLFLFFNLTTWGQFGEKQDVTNPLIWHTSVVKTGTNTYNLIFEADIADGWHLYSQFNDPNASLPIEFEWHNNKGQYKVLGKAKEINTHQAYNKVFKATETFFTKHAKLIQPVEVLNPDLKEIKVTLYGQACKDACIQVQKDFTFDLTKAKSGAADAGKSNPPKSKHQVVGKPKKDLSNQTEETPEKDLTEGGKYTPVPVAKQPATRLQQAEKPHTNVPAKNNNWSIFWTAFIAGLLVLLTPCVFPMIPLTISFFTKQSEKAGNGKKNALVYALSIVLIYVVFSLPFHLLEKVDSRIFNNLATNTWVNLFFFLIFILFALNLFGVEKLDPVRLIPNSWVSSADKQSSKGGVFAGFFMALTLVIVSFSCTGPALGFILGNAASGAEGAMTFTYAMLGFGLGIALPFGILAFFPVLLKKLPQSGAWLNSVKVIFGFIELAFAFKFLSNADLVNQWHFLHREVFISIWVAITLTMAMYLFGKIRLPHDAPTDTIGVFRFLLGIFTLAFALYLLPGLWGAPLNVISGFPPPMKYAESKFGVGYSKINSATITENKLPEGAKYGPNNIVVFEDYDTALAYAKKINKPLLIDFTGRACQNCRLMEENVWRHDKILPILKNKVVLVSLFVDERTKLPKEKQYISPYTGDKVTTVGQKWSEMETFRYKNNSQPLYIMVDHSENNLNEPVGYTPDIDTYYNWLQKGLNNFNNKTK